MSLIAPRYVGKQQSIYAAFTNMTLFQQILWGSLYLSACLILQVVFLSAAEFVLSRVNFRLRAKGLFLHVMTMLVFSLFFIVSAHTTQVWVWAAVFVHTDVLQDWNTSVYFSLVTYTSLGYGDIVLGPGLRIFAAFAAVTGLLGFGISTAYLVSLLGRITGENTTGSGR